jgi:putative DNA primase/helicase
MLKARRLHENLFAFKPSAKIWLATNYRPEVHGTDLGIWRRIKLVPFTVTIPESEQDRKLSDKLRAHELPGILAWIVRGAGAWAREGLGTSGEVVAATAAYRCDMDHLGEFIAECCVLDASLSIPAGALFQQYESWAEGEGREVMSQTTFGTRLTDRGVGKGRDKATGRTVRLGIGVPNRGSAR